MIVACLSDIAVWEDLVSVMIAPKTDEVSRTQVGGH